MITLETLPSDVLSIIMKECGPNLRVNRELSRRFEEDIPEHTKIFRLLRMHSRYVSMSALRPSYPVLYNEWWNVNGALVAARRFETSPGWLSKKWTSVLMKIVDRITMSAAERDATDVAVYTQRSKSVCFFFGTRSDQGHSHDSRS